MINYIADGSCMRRRDGNVLLSDLQHFTNVFLIRPLWYVEAGY